MATLWPCYVVVGIYSTLLIGCAIGLTANRKKKQQLISNQSYEKSKAAISWKRRFYVTLMLATICRISALIGAIVFDQKLMITQAVNESQLEWQMAAAFGSMLYFTAFSLIAWFFAKICYHKDSDKQTITTLIIIINVMLYFSNIILALSDYITDEWDLIYDIQLPLFSVFNCILALFFLLLSCKIAKSITIEKQQTVNYHIEHSYSGQIGSIKRGNIRQINEIPPPPPVQSRWIVPRLIKLSILCASIWTVRACYTAALRIWPTARMVPFDMEPLVWEAIFFCITEYPPSLGALFLMILKPKKSKIQSIAEPPEQYYPSAVDDIRDVE